MSSADSRQSEGGRLRAAALALLAAVPDAIAPARLVAERLGGAGWGAEWLGDSHRHAGRSIHLLAVGKAAAAMAAGADAALGAQIVGGLVVTSGDATTVPARLERRAGSHPHPDATSVAAGAAVRRLVEGIPPEHALLVLLSGGASSLIVEPGPGLSLYDLHVVNALLLGAPLPIDAVNAVRKHVDLLKGGRLAFAARARTVLVLTISDVIGDRLDAIGSGPFHPDPTTYAEATAALRGAGLWSRAPESVRRLLERGEAGDIPETPKPGAEIFARVRHEVVAGNGTARAALAAAAEGAGFRVVHAPEPVDGPATAAGTRLAGIAQELSRAVAPGGKFAGERIAWIGGGETVVHVTGNGRGGRNQQLALAASIALVELAAPGAPAGNGIVIASLATDGVDGPTDAAGAIVDPGTVARMKAGGVDPHDALRRNDSWTALEAAGDLLRTGPTGTNVADVQLVLVAPDG
jgi:glycerate 2-kinase